MEVPVEVTTHVPAELRQCAAIPGTPGAGSTQADVAGYIVDLNEVAVECKTKLDKVDEILRQQVAP